MANADMSWLEEDDDERRAGPRRSHLMVALAAVPWVVVVALLALRGGPAASPAPELPASHTDEAMGPVQSSRSDEAVESDIDTVEGWLRPDPRVGATDGSTGGSASDLELVELRGGWRVEPGPEEAAALAIVIARAWLTGLDPQLAIDGIDVTSAEGYAEHLVVEAIEQPAPEASVVTLLAVLLDGDDGLRARVRRLAVPLAWERDGPRPAGPPWWLPGPDLDPLLPELTVLDDPDEHLAALDALEAAGIVDAELLGLWRTSGWPVIADVAGRTSDGVAVDGPLWLRRHLDGFVVAGTPLRRTVGQGPTDTARMEVGP